MPLKIHYVLSTLLMCFLNLLLNFLKDLSESQKFIGVFEEHHLLLYVGVLRMKAFWYDTPTRKLKYICYILQWFYLPSRVSSYTRKRSERLILCVKDFKFGCEANAVWSEKFQHQKNNVISASCVYTEVAPKFALSSWIPAVVGSCLVSAFCFFLSFFFFIWSHSPLGFWRWCARVHVIFFIHVDKPPHPQKYVDDRINLFKSCNVTPWIR